jgi:hypothetical protein
MPKISSRVADILGPKTGKYDYFKAREVNKLTLSKQAEQAAEQTAVHTTIIHENVTPIDYGNFDNPLSAQRPGSPPRIPDTQSSPIVAGESTPIRRVHFTPSAAAAPVNPSSYDAEPTSTSSARTPRLTNQPLAPSPWIITGDNFLNSPQPEDWSAPFDREHDEDDEDMTSASAFNQRKMGIQSSKLSTADSGSRRTYVGISDIVDCCQQESNMARVIDSKGKRKCDEISKLNKEEKEWEAGLSRRESSSAAPATVPHQYLPRKRPEASSATATPSKTIPASEAVLPALLKLPKVSPTSVAPVATDAVRDVPPAKRQRLHHRLAERLGYAVLGGATVGAMVLGSLICTAPSFT